MQSLSCSDVVNELSARVECPQGTATAQCGSQLSPSMDFCFQLGYRHRCYVKSLRIETADIDAHSGSLLHGLLHPSPVQAALQPSALSVHCGVVMLEQAGDSEEAAVSLAAQLVTELYRFVG